MRETILTLGIAVAGCLESGCSDYALNRVNENEVSEYIEATEDTGEDLESYDPCDSYDAGWNVSPSGDERPSCYAIKSNLERINEEDNTIICTTIDYRACFDNYGTIEMVMNNKEIFGTTGYIASQATCNGEPGFLSFCFIGDNYENGEQMSTANAYADFDLWLISQEEEDKMEEEGVVFLSEKEEYITENHAGEQLFGVVECRNDEHYVSDCSGAIY